MFICAASVAPRDEQVHVPILWHETVRLFTRASSRTVAWSDRIEVVELNQRLVVSRGRRQRFAPKSSEAGTAIPMPISTSDE